MIHLFDDEKWWGRQTLMALGRQGSTGKLFKRVNEVPKGAVAFVRMDQTGSVRKECKDMVAALNANKCLTFPSLKEAELYDDKVAQMEYLSPWMPYTELHKSYESALGTAHKRNYPIVSKSLDGSASKTVRLLATPDEAIAEAKKIFTIGMSTIYGRRQRNYTYWQDCILGNDFDYRVVVTGAYIFGLKRHNLRGTLFASGSGQHEPMIDLDLRWRAAFEMCDEISDRYAFHWMCYDIVFEGDEPLVLEMSSAWMPYAYHACRMYTRYDYEATDYYGGHMFDMAAMLLMDMEASK